MEANRPLTSVQEDQEEEIEYEQNGDYKPTTVFDYIREHVQDFINRTFSTIVNIEYFQRKDWYDDLKSKARWCFDQGSIRITFDDVMLLMTLFVLFGESIELATLRPYADAPFAVAISICMFAFIFELIVNSWSRSRVTIQFNPKFKFSYHGYIFSFFWWFDLLAIVSIWPDIPWIAEPMHIVIIASSNTATGNISNAGRVVRLVRLVKFVRLYRLWMERRRIQQYDEFLQELILMNEIDLAEAQKRRQLNFDRQSKLGSQLSSKIVQYLILVLLIMMLGIPLLTYSPVDNGPKYGLSFIHEISKNQSLSNGSKIAVVQEYMSIMAQGPISSPASILIQLIVSPLYPNAVYSDQYRLDNLRDGSNYDIAYVSYDPINDITYRSKGVFDDRQILYLLSQYSIYLTICVGFLLLVGYVVFTADVQRLVLSPIGRMMNMVEIVAQDPLQPLQVNKVHVSEKQFKVQSGLYEMEVLELSLEKVTGLLRVGFGEAGAGIIRSNLHVDSSSSVKADQAVIDALLPGVRVYAIFGFCDIHHFEEISVALTKDVLTFVNTIAEIVHSSVHTWNGQCNKNLGNAFVVVWRIGDEYSLLEALQNTAIAIRSVISPRDRNSQISENDNSSVKSKPSRITTVDFSKKDDRDEVKSFKYGELSNHYKAFKDRPGAFLPAEDDTSPSFYRSTKKSFIMRDSASERFVHDGRSDKDSDQGKSRAYSRLSSGTSDRSGSDRDRPALGYRRGSKIDLNKIPGVDRLADSALVSYLKIIAEINRSQSILNYRSEPRLIPKKPQKVPSTPRTPAARSPSITSNHSHEEFKVRMGFGLHAGWGIEGAVGSVHKVDATYLSPHVNTAARLETASRQYKVPLLMSHAFHDLMSDVTKSKCRKIDSVLVKGSSVPIGVFTYDCLQDQVFSQRTKADYLLYMGIRKRRGSSFTKEKAKPSSRNSGNTETDAETGQGLESMEGSQRNSEPPPPPAPTGPSRFPSLYNGSSPLSLSGPSSRRTSLRKIEEESDPSKNSVVRVRRSLSLDLPSKGMSSKSIAEDDEKKDNRRLSDGSSPTIPPTPSGTMVRSQTSFRANVSAADGITISELSLEFPPKSPDFSPPTSRRRSSAASLLFPQVEDDEEAENSKKSNEISSDSIAITIPTETKSVAYDNQSTEVDDVKESQSDDKSLGDLPSFGDIYEASNVIDTYQRVPTSPDEPKSTLFVAVSDKSFSPTPPSPDNPPSMAPSPRKRRQSIISMLFSNVDAPEASPQPVESNDSQAIDMPSDDLEQENSIDEDEAQLNTVGSSIVASVLPMPLSYLESPTPFDTASNGTNPNSSHIFFMTPEDDIEDILNNDTDLLNLRKHVTPEFLAAFNEGFQNYTQGQWLKAKLLLETSNSIMAVNAPSLGGDGPSQTLLNYMKSFKYVAPPDWKGVRALTNK